MKDFWKKGNARNHLQSKFFAHPDVPVINQFESILSTFFLVYSNNHYPAAAQLDNFYSKQEEDGAIRGEYNVRTGKPEPIDRNPLGVNPPLFAWAEYNLYHRVGSKRRLKEILPILDAYHKWLDDNFKDETGFYNVPQAATMMHNLPRDGAVYFIDFNAQVALSMLYLSELADILNDKDRSFQYKRNYFALKTVINNHMWSEEDQTYYDLTPELEPVRVRSLAAYWTMLAEIPTEARAEKMTEHLVDPELFGVEHPFPTLAANEPKFSDRGEGYRGSVLPPLTFVVVKALEKYGKFELAREAAIRHLFYVVETLQPEGKEQGSLWEAYLPRKDGHAHWRSHPEFPRKLHLHFAGLSTITLMIENVLGLYVSLPRKTVDMIVPTLELMGIEHLSLKRNKITIMTSKSSRGWEIRLESEKLYYFTLDLLQQIRKTWPIPAGKCSVLPHKLH